MGEEELELRAVTVRTGEHADLSLRVAPPCPPSQDSPSDCSLPEDGGWENLAGLASSQLGTGVSLLLGYLTDGNGMWGEGRHGVGETGERE